MPLVNVPETMVVPQVCIQRNCHIEMVRADNAPGWIVQHNTESTPTPREYAEDVAAWLNAQPHDDVEIEGTPI